MDKLEVLCRAWIDCDPNRAGSPPGSGFHADDLMPGTHYVEVRNKEGQIIGVESQSTSDDMAGQPRWRWFLPRAVALEQYLEERGYVIVKIEQAKQ